MKKKNRLILIFMSMVLVIVSLLAFGYALWPIANASLQVVLPSGLFVSP